MVSSTEGLCYHELINHIIKAKKRVVIINTFIPQLDSLIDPIRQALNPENKEIAVEIFLLNPESPLTRERSESAKDPSKSPAEIKSTEDDVKEGIERNLDLLAER